MSVVWKIYDNGTNAERFCSRYVGKLINKKNGMVLNETYPHNDIEVVSDRIHRSVTSPDAPIEFVDLSN